VTVRFLFLLILRNWGSRQTTTASVGRVKSSSKILHTADYPLSSGLILTYVRDPWMPEYHQMGEMMHIFRRVAAGISMMKVSWVPKL